MRLSSKQILAIQKSCNLLLQDYKNSKVYLFGSRVDDNLKGGDIDLLFEIPCFKGSLMEFQMRFETEYCKLHDDEKIDIVVYDPNKKEDNAFISSIKKRILLWEKI